jgi:ubiquinone/menaquinone biosynthesis C-methylase UbiE
MAEFHFVEDYERHVDLLMQNHPLDEAMSLAVGGRYEEIGAIASDILLGSGLEDGASVFDFGCGSGRVAHSLADKVRIERFVGTDVVQSLLDYASSKTPDHYQFLLHRELSIPVPDNSVDFAYAFSVFTHLLQTECFAYLRDLHRALREGGILVISFLEFAAPAHWAVFEASLGAPHLNTFIDRIQWSVWAEKSGFEIVEYIDGTESRSEHGPLGQSVVVMKAIPLLG